MALLHKELSRYYHFRAEKREIELPPDTADAAAGPDSIAMTALLLDGIWSAARELPALSQKCLSLCYGFDQPVARIAEALDLSETAVKSRLHRARMFVRAPSNEESV